MSDGVFLATARTDETVRGPNELADLPGLTDPCGMLASHADVRLDHHLDDWCISGKRMTPALDVSRTQSRPDRL
jgi:hypothetical protein